MVNVGWIYADVGTEADTELIGVTDGVEHGSDGSDIVDLDLTEEQSGQLSAAYAAYRSQIDIALDEIERARERIAKARAAYDATAGWAVPLYEAARDHHDEQERAAFRAECERQAREEQARLDAEDAEKGHRLFVKVERPIQERKRFPFGDPRRWRIHVFGCRYSYGVTRDNLDGIRMDDACELYLAGALACGVCKSDDLMAADTVDGERVRAARTNREGKPVNVTEHQLKQAITTVRWRRGTVPGLVVMSTQSFNVGDGEAVVGWRDPARNHGEQIPYERRDAVFQAAASRKGWVAEWNSNRDRTRPGYLIVRAKTKAEIRAEKERSE